jgi:hypothetical protein
MVVRGEQQRIKSNKTTRSITMKKSKIAVRDLKARKDVKGGTSGHQYTSKGNQTSSFGNQYTSNRNQYTSSGNQASSTTSSY